MYKFTFRDVGGPAGAFFIGQTACYKQGTALRFRLRVSIGRSQSRQRRPNIFAQRDARGVSCVEAPAGPLIDQTACYKQGTALRLRLRFFNRRESKQGSGDQTYCTTRCQRHLLFVGKTGVPTRQKAPAGPPVARTIF